MHILSLHRYEPLFDALRTKVKAFAGSYGMPGKPFGKYNPEP